MTLAVKKLSLTINDKTIDPIDVPEAMMMQDFLYEYLNLTGSRMGCGQGVCHACTVIVEKDDGTIEEMRTCITGAHWFAGKKVRTVEGHSKRDAAGTGTFKISPDKTVRVTATYPGANAKVVADTVAAPIEQQVNGVENMIYMGKGINDGQMLLDVTFKPGTDLNMAQVLVQNRVAIAQPRLPEIVKNVGVTVKKSPATMDITIKGSTIPAIYELKGDELKICHPFTERGARPRASDEPVRRQLRSTVLAT